jgi:hypothetical protein
MSVLSYIYSLKQIWVDMVQGASPLANYNVLRNCFKDSLNVINFECVIIASWIEFSDLSTSANK